MSAFDPKQTLRVGALRVSFLRYRSSMKATRVMAWLGFGLFVALSWTALGLYFFVAGQGPCDVGGSCWVDQSLALFALVLLPLQVLVFVWMRQRSDDNGS